MISACKMSTASTNEEFCRISNGLYTIVNGVVGQESEVRTNRQLYNFIDIFESSNNQFRTFLMSGSKAEGFSFESSDIDVMAINKDVLVIDNELQNVFNTNFFHMVLLMETDSTPPGFTLLKCIRYDSRAQVDDIFDTLLARGDSVYMSSQRAQQIILLGGMSSVHGPCRSGITYGIEYDCAYTLKCPFWPKPAFSFILRSIRNGWPPTENLISILKEGCLLVPISSKQRSLSDNVDLEWRISFSLAEKKLVYSMNHCQFLCYGLMKIFLNEVLKDIPETKTETGNILCSYFMKTAVFWEISENVNDWSNQTFLNKFLNVFRRVIKWVEDGYCPNFFIPENNMFNGKIFGRRQRELMSRLCSLYDEEILCLFHCVSLKDKLSVMLNDGFQFDSTEVALIKMITVTHSALTPMFDIEAMKKELCYTASLEPDSPEMLSTIRLRINFLLQMTALILAKRGFEHLISNKLQYLCTKRARSILRKTKTSYCFGTILQALIAYINGEYHKTIQIVDDIKYKLQTKPYVYLLNMQPAIIMESRQQGLSHEEIIKRFIINFFPYMPDLQVSTCIPELILEGTASKQNGPLGMIIIPPLVFLNFLVILSYTQVNKPMERMEALYELYSTLYDDNNPHIQYIEKPISWEILGICQRLCGAYVGAYQSYLNAFNDEHCEFKEATIIRLLRLLSDRSLFLEMECQLSPSM